MLPDLELAFCCPNHREYALNTHSNWKLTIDYHQEKGQFITLDKYVVNCVSHGYRDIILYAPNNVLKFWALGRKHTYGNLNAVEIEALLFSKDFNFASALLRYYLKKYSLVKIKKVNLNVLAFLDFNAVRNLIYCGHDLKDDLNIVTNHDQFQLIKNTAHSTILVSNTKISISTPQIIDPDPDSDDQFGLDTPQDNAQYAHVLLTHNTTKRILGRTFYWASSKTGGEFLGVIEKGWVIFLDYYFIDSYRGQKVLTQHLVWKAKNFNKGLAQKMLLHFLDSFDIVATSDEQFEKGKEHVDKIYSYQF